MISANFSIASSGFNSRLREEATKQLNELKNQLGVSTHASVRRRLSLTRPVHFVKRFQLTPP